MKARMTSPLIALMATLVLGMIAAPVQAQNHDATIKKADESIAKAIDFLKSKQAEDGSWMANPKFGATKASITGLITAGLLRNGMSPDDPMIQKAVAYTLKHQQEDGSFAAPGGHIPVYTTALSLLALGQLRDDPKIDAAIKKAHKWAEEAQWKEGMRIIGKGFDVEVTKEDRSYGGFGYGKHGRPDISNTGFMLEALYDSGYDCESPTFQRAMVFMSRLQGAETNDLFADQIVNNGGFIYSLSINSKTKENYETLRTEAQAGQGRMKIGGVNNDGTMRLQTYGSVTYMGFKSMLYAKMGKEDPRVKAALGFITNNYNVFVNPNAGQMGYYYNFYVKARALHAYSETEITLPVGAKKNWAVDMIDVATQIQKSDGSFYNEAHSRWMEDEKELVTAYVLMALIFSKDALLSERQQVSQPLD